ncbi:MAG: LytTR family transcriptional regulator, partial [Blautia sp.]|nr:LytTR family transcriptional regulator [Blautia sp.]
TVSEYGTLSAAGKKLSDPSFVRPNRSMLVNLRFVTRLGRDEVEVAGKSLAIARPQRQEFKKAYMGFLDGQRQKRGG